MHRLRGTRRNRWQGSNPQQQQQPISDGRMKARSLIPVLVLVTCMVAVLYGNVTLYTEKETHPSALLDDGEASGTAEAIVEEISEHKSATKQSGEAIGGVNGKIFLPEEADFPAVRVDEAEEGDGKLPGEMEASRPGDREGKGTEGGALHGGGGGSMLEEHEDGVVVAVAGKAQSLANQGPEGEGEGENVNGRTGGAPMVGSAAVGDKKGESGVVDGDVGGGTGEATRPVDGESGLEDGPIADKRVIENQPGREEGAVVDVVAGGGDMSGVNERKREEGGEARSEGDEVVAAGKGQDRKPEGVSMGNRDGDKEQVKGGQKAPEVKGGNKVGAIQLPTTGFVEWGGVPAVNGAIGGDDKNLPPNGAVQGTMECSMIKKGEGADNIPNIATWKVVPGDADYRGPLMREAAASNTTRYVTLEKDLGAFNNIRLSLECAVAFAAATGRTFVIPPPFPVWNMNTGIKQKEVDLRSLFTFDKLRESGRVDVITTEEFLEREAFSGNLGVFPPEEVKRLKQMAVSKYLEKVGGMYEKGLPELKVEKAAFIMPRRMNERVDFQSPSYDLAKEWLYGRMELEYFDLWPEAKVVHWRAHEARLLAPFYSFILHADEVADRYYKRLMRDLMHYPEEVYCKASQVIALIKKEDPSGSFSSFHIRRNDFVNAYKAVVIEPDKMVEISVDHLREHEVLYIATDEKNKEFFKPFRERYRVRFLSDYYERAAVAEMNPNYIGMLEQIIASHGRTFTGCWFSTFTAYILRLRGHLKKPRVSNWSYYPPKKKYHHAFHMPENPLWASEWPFGWEGIDATGVPDLMAP